MERKDMIKRIAVAGGGMISAQATSLIKAQRLDENVKVFNVKSNDISLDGGIKFNEELKKFQEENPDIKIVVNIDDIEPSMGRKPLNELIDDGVFTLGRNLVMEENPIPRKDRHGKFVAVTPRQKTGRNALCGCGSGIKVKNCCKNIKK